MFTLRFKEDQLRSWAHRYEYESEEMKRLAVEAGQFMREHGYLTKPLFLGLCRWKSPRTKPHCQRNQEDFIEAVTRISLSTSNERLKIEVLTLLNGVSWPTASAILHFGDHELYPILDFRALWSLGFESPPRYNFDFWWAYTTYCRQLAATHEMTMRELDQALWQFSKTNQGKSYA